MPPPLQLKLFGSPQILYQGQPLNGFVSAKVRALLIYLAVTSRPQSRDHLAELLWADTPASTRTNLRKAISNLRQLIGDILVEDGKESISLDARQVWVDVSEFGHLIKNGFDPEATDLYQADFLHGFNLSLSYEFEAWALSEQSRLKSQMVELLRSLATQHTSTALSTGSSRNTLSHSISTVRRLLDLEPWHEENHRCLMELLAKDGQRSAALAHFEVCKKVLKEELDVEPSAETLALVERIQRASETTSHPRPKPTSTPKPEFPLIGREKELQIIQQAWQRSLQQGAHFVSIAGEAGIGKTRLTEEVRIWVEAQGYATVYARSYAAEGALAYSPVVDWLRSEPIRSALDLLDKVWLNEIVRLLPELVSAHPQLAPSRPIADALQRRRFFEAVARSITVRGQPLLLVFDDLQWCDRETLEWLRFLLRFEPEYPLLVLGAYRVEEVDREHQLYEFFGSLRQIDQVTDLELRPLNSKETSELANLVSNEEVAANIIATLYQETSGHPLFLIESIRNQKGKLANIPSTNGVSKVENVIQARVSRLSAETRELVEVAATIGRSFSLELLKHASQRDEKTVLRQLDELWQRRMIVEKEPAQFDFSHDRIREVVYATIRPVNRLSLHHQIGDTLKSIHADDLSEWNGQIAIHYQLAGKPVDALPYFVEAVEVLFGRQWAYTDALVMINRALSIASLLPETETNLRHLLNLRVIQYDSVLSTKGYTSPQLREIIDSTSQLSKKLNDHRHEFMARVWLRGYYGFRAEWVQERIIAEENLALAQSINDQALIFEGYFDLAGSCFNMGEITVAKSLYDQATTIIEAFEIRTPLSYLGRLTYVEFYTAVAGCYYLLGYFGQAKQLEMKALELVQATNNPNIIGYFLKWNMDHKIRVDRKHYSFKSSAEQLYTICQKYEFVSNLQASKLYQGWALVLEGCYEQGIRMIQQVIDHCEQSQLLASRIRHLVMLAESYRMAGCYEEGIATIHKVLAFCERNSARSWLPEIFRLEGALLLESHRNIGEAEESYQKSLEISRQQRSRLLELRTSVSLARLWQSQGKRDKAYQLLAPIYNWFSEGFDMPDLVEAKQLLAEL